jgi:BirA family biotin operon repressor/biotin-[acetyl-CoA-carboxylase] ligase
MLKDRRASPDLARAREAIASRGCALGAPLVIAEETTSTNDDAKHGARHGAPHGAVWLAESQTSGRGRQGRAWLSGRRRGENLLFSVLLRLRCPPARVPPVSLACGLAVRDAVARALGGAADADVLVKWPNDVLVRSPRDGVLRKVAGVLVESALSGANVEYVVVGIGINVLVRSLPDEVAGTATSIALERDARGAGAGELDRAEILADVLAQLDRDASHVAHKGLGLVHARLTRHDAMAGQQVESVAEDGTAGDLRGVASGIDLDGRLLVRGADGVVTRVSSGELRLRAV